MDAIPLAPRANLDHYRKLAKDLLAAWKSNAEDAAHGWARRWLENLAQLHGADSTLLRIEDEAKRVVLMVQDEAKQTVSLTDAQYVLARLHGFDSWPRFTKHVNAVRQPSTEDAQFEAAADAVVSGDLVTLREVLRTTPALIRARSSRRYGSTLLHYASANGIEAFRQRTPANALDVARMLIDAGAEVDARDHGNGTSLGLVATSAHAIRAGVQLSLMELLVAAGADVNGVVGGWQPMRAAVANGCPEAAEWLAAHGAQMDVVTAAGIGRLDVLERCLAADGVSRAQLEKAFVFACGRGRTAAAELLLDRGVDIAALDGQTGLHLAIHSAHLETVRFLLARRAPLELKNRYGGTALGQALWSAVRNRDLDYVPIIEALLAAGAVVDPSWSTGIDAIDERLHRAVGKT